MLPVLLAALVLAGIPAQSLEADRAAPVRHVVLVLLDDVGIDKVGAYGVHPTAGPTPVLDAMAAEGVLFRAAYAHPVCSPTRCSILTGRQPGQTGIGKEMPLGSTATAPTNLFAPGDDLDWLPRRLSRRGLLCDAVGKWHLTHELVPDFHLHPALVGFRRHAGHLGNLGNWTDVEDQGYWSWKKNSATAQGWFETTVTTYATLDTAWEAWLSLVNAAAAGRRSFTWLAFNAAHKPWDQPPPELFTGDFSSAPAQQEAVLEACDTLLGQLRSAWAAANPDEAARTLWIVMGDNGTHEDAVEPPWPKSQSKGSLMEGGIHVPLIATGPGVSQGAECSAPVHAADLWATVLDVFGYAPTGNEPTSLSFAGAFADPAGFQGRGWVYSRIHEPNGFGPYLSNLRVAIRADGWKLRINDFQGEPTAYHLKYLPDDPFELFDLYPPSTPEAQAAFDELLLAIAQSDAP